MVAIIDYGVGNLFSLHASFQAVGQPSVVTSDPAAIAAASHVILPGVGAFADAAAKLRASGLDEVVRGEIKKGKPVMGICLGMQLLFEKSYEFGEHAGLSLLQGAVVPMAGTIPEGLKIPHIGWNALHVLDEANPIFRYTTHGECVYFVHSFYAAGCDDSCIATAEYGREITAAVNRDNLFGCQFHPEKSGAAGLSILRAFCEIKG